MAEITESQRLWEAWFQAFSKIREAWPEPTDVPCPNGDGGRVRIAYIGDPNTRIGTAFIWCDVCRQGIFLSRVGIPEGADMLTFDASDEEQEAIIPNNIEFLPPDPIPPAEGADDNRSDKRRR